MRLIYRPYLRFACSSARPLPRRNIYCFHSAPVSRGIMTSSEPHEAQDVPKEVSEAQEAEGWKTQLPYKIHEKQSFNALYDASCHCGRVMYQLSREKPLDAKFCHCKTCQRLHGAPFQWAAIFHKQDINFINGYNNLVWYESSEKVLEHRLPCKITCSYCRTPIMDEGRNMILLFPTLINFKSQEDRKKFDPTCHIFYGSRVVDISDGRPKWSGINGQSTLLDDSLQDRKTEAMKDGTEVSPVKPTI